MTAKRSVPSFGNVPPLLLENARGTERCKWGSPMAYVANVDHTDMVAMLS
ncbi:hypothetical protein BH11ARM2_BH11ARM2_04650 [soil metagenome]